MIAVVDYGRGNLFSMGQALRELGHSFTITDNPDEVARAKTLILPGVGAFGDAMAQLNITGLSQAVTNAAAAGRRVIGICLGMQLLATRSEEFGDHLGLGLIPGNVLRLPDPTKGSEEKVRIPNMGWRRVAGRNGFVLPEGLDQSPYFYFVHSFGFHCAHADDMAGSIVVNGAEVAAIVGRGNVWGFQFHPEKSGQAGLTLLDHFLSTKALSGVKTS